MHCSLTRIVIHINLVWATLKRAKELSQLFLFLGAWFIYSDAFSTLVNIAILFSQSELGAPLELLLIATIIFPIAAGMGNYFWLGVQKKFKFSTKAMICIQCGFYGLIPLYGLIGFFVPEGSIIGLSNKYELPFVAFLHGFMLAATLSSCRVLFSELLPKGHEGEFFGLYEITDKGSSWVGPLIVALITQWTGSLRYSFLFIFSSFLIPMWMFSMVDVLKGKEQAHNYHEKYDPHK